MTITRWAIPKGGGGDSAVEDSNNKYDDDYYKNDEKKDVMDVLPPLLARIVERLKCLSTERERVMERYLGERAALEMKYSDLCKPLYEDRGNVVAGCLDDEIERIHMEGGCEKE